jgi:hypothetical protein
MSKRDCVTILEGRRLAIGLMAVAFALMLSIVAPTSRAEAACTVPNQISNGQLGDATALMGNFNAVKDCVDSVVTPSGTPAAGNLPVFTGANSVTNGNLSGDCTTSGTLTVTCTKSNGVALSPLATSTDAGQLTGTMSVSRFNNGLSADVGRFLRGDGQWATPPGGTGGAPPSIRASQIQAFNGNTVTITWPTGTVTGDVVIIFVADGYALNSPAGWVILNNSSGGNNWANALTVAKIMTAADITAGSVTVTLVGPYNGVAAAVAIDGSTLSHVEEVSAQRSLGDRGYPSASVGGLVKASDTDLIIGFTYVRGTMNPSISNFSQLQLLNFSYASAFLGRYTSTFGKLGMIETATYPAAYSEGYYWSLVALR